MKGFEHSESGTRMRNLIMLIPNCQYEKFFLLEGLEDSVVS